MARLSANVDDDVKEILDEFAERFIEPGQRKPLGKILDYLVLTLYADSAFWDNLERDIRNANAEFRDRHLKTDRERKRKARANKKRTA